MALIVGVVVTAMGSVVDKSSSHPAAVAAVIVGAVVGLGVLRSLIRPPRERPPSQRR